MGVCSERDHRLLILKRRLTGGWIWSGAYARQFPGNLLVHRPSAKAAQDDKLLINCERSQISLLLYSSKIFYHGLEPERYIEVRLGTF